MVKKYHETLYEYLTSGGAGLILEVYGRAYHFRIPTPSDFIGSQKYGSFWKDQEAWLISSCLIEVGGFRVDPHDQYEILKYIQSLPKFQNRVSHSFWASVDSLNHSLRKFEAFCYTSISRNLWEKWKVSNEMGVPVDALQKLRTLSDFHVQWIAYNQIEDKKAMMEDAWGRTFFSASAMNPKGVEKVQKDWNARKEKEHEYRREMVERAENEEELSENERERLKGGKTFEDLKAEYQRWVDGEEDDHDRIVREYKENLTRHLTDQKVLIERQQQDALEMQQSLSELNSLSMQGAPMRAYSDDEIQKMLGGQNKAVHTIDEGSEYANHLSQRYLSAQEVIRDQAPSLMDQVSKRKPTL